MTENYDMTIYSKIQILRGNHWWLYIQVDESISGYIIYGYWMLDSMPFGFTIIPCNRMCN